MNFFQEDQLQDNEYEKQNELLFFGKSKKIHFGKDNKNLQSFTYKQNIDKNKIDEEFYQIRQKLAFNPDWRIKKLQYETLKAKQWLTNVQQAFCNELQISSTASLTSIIKQIEHIKFGNLQSLLLFGNCIESIQPLSNIYLPNLLSLHLGSNKIIFMSSLRRMNIPQIYSIIFGQNYINQLESLFQLKSSNLHQVGVDSGPKTYYHYPQLRRMDQSLQWAYKVQSNKINDLERQNYLRMSNHGYNQLHLLRKKFPKMFCKRLYS